MSQALLQLLQCAGWAKVFASSHSCFSLLHCAVACEVMSSERQCEQTGVDRADRAGRPAPPPLSSCARSCF